MDVIIRNVDEEAYREFKAQAVRKGVKMSEALVEAISLWIKSSLGGKVMGKDVDNVAYDRSRGELEEKYRGKYVAISDGNSFRELVRNLRNKGLKKALTVHVGVDESGYGGEWLWGSLGREGA